MDTYPAGCSIHEGGDQRILIRAFSRMFSSFVHSIRNRPRAVAESNCGSKMVVNSEVNIMHRLIRVLLAQSFFPKLINGFGHLDRGH